jgi:hypothetical protein
MTTQPSIEPSQTLVVRIISLPIFLLAMTSMLILYVTVTGMAALYDTLFSGKQPRRPDDSHSNKPQDDPTTDENMEG